MIYITSRLGYRHSARKEFPVMKDNRLTAKLNKLMIDTALIMSPFIGAGVCRAGAHTHPTHRLINIAIKAPIYLRHEEKSR